MAYDVALGRLSVPDYQTILKNQTLLPSRLMLHNNIDENFAAIQNMGIENIAQLKKALSSAKKLDAFAKGSGIKKEYLVLLKRQIGSLAQKRVPLDAFSDMDSARIQALAATGIKTSKDYYDSAESLRDDLYRLCDLVRINGMGALAAHIFLEAGYTSVLDVAKADADTMLENIKNVIVREKYSHVNLGIKDIRFCIEGAQLIIQLP